MSEAEEVQKLLESAIWTFASTRPRNPHWYTHIRSWANHQAFYRCVEYIRSSGYDAWFYGKPTPAPGNPPYRKWQAGLWVYWSMGWPVRETQLINRAKISDEPPLIRPKRKRPTQLRLFDD